MKTWKLFPVQEFNRNLSYAGIRQVSIFLKDYVILEGNTALDTFIIFFFFNCRFSDYFAICKECDEPLWNKQQIKNGHTLQFDILQKLL